MRLDIAKLPKKLRYAVIDAGISYYVEMTSKLRADHPDMSEVRIDQIATRRTDKLQDKLVTMATPAQVEGYTQRAIERLG